MYRKQRGLSLIEVVVSLAIIGFISLLTVPSILYSANANNALFKTKNCASELMSGLNKYRQENPSLTPTAQDLARRTHYVTTLTTGTAPVTASLTCSSAAPCFLFSDGGVLIPMSDSATWPDHRAFHFDPDGTGPLTRTILKLDVVAERVGTRDTMESTTGTDPDYVRPWTRL